MKKVYVASTNTITINKGRLDFFKASKEFSTIIDSFANSKYKIACIDRECKSMIKARETLIDEKIKYAKTATYVDQTAHEEEIAKLEKEIADIDTKKKALILSIMSKQYALTDIDENVWCAYRECKNGTLAKKEYVQAIAQWFASFGVEAYADTINTIIDSIGMKKASNGQILKSEGKDFVGTLNPKAYAEMFYRTVADMAAKAGTIKPFDFNKTYYEA